MTLEDAIRHAEEVEKEKEEASKRWKECKDSQTIEWSKLYFDSVEEIIEKCDKCAAEHRQLAEWLKELKELREQFSAETCSGCVNDGNLWSAACECCTRMATNNYKPKER